MNLALNSFDGPARIKHEELVKDFFRAKARSADRRQQKPHNAASESSTARQRRFERRHAERSLQQT
jgi:hypothetical protein